MTPSTDPGAPESPPWRGVVAGPLVAIVTVLTTLIVTRAAGVPLRDPNNMAARRLLVAAGIVAGLVALDIVVRAGRRSGKLRPSRTAIRRVRRERWSLWRGVAVGSAVVSFYVTYLAYRNLKSVVPLLRPGERFDRQLADLDRSLFGGNDPAALLHTLLGTGLPTHVLSAVYMLFFYFVPISLALALVFSPDLRGALFYVTAQSLNWVLAAASYFVLPALGPIYAEPAAFAHLPSTEVSHLQDVLMDQRVEFLHDPAAAGAAQSIGAFSSLHVSIVFTAAVAAHLLGLERRLKMGVWVLLGSTVVATIYFGWHYVLDDVGGLLISVMALALARTLTGVDLRAARRRRA